MITMLALNLTNATLEVALDTTQLFAILDNANNLLLAILSLELANTPTSKTELTALIMTFALCQITALMEFVPQLPTLLALIQILATYSEFVSHKLVNAPTQPRQITPPAMTTTLVLLWTLAKLEFVLLESQFNAHMLLNVIATEFVSQNPAFALILAHHPLLEPL